MIAESLKILLLGMAGIFIVMGIIVIAVLILNHCGKKSEEKAVIGPENHSGGCATGGSEFIE